jgi:hypothetical protein
MPTTSGPNDKARVGDAFPTLELAATSGQQVTVPDLAGDYVHLQLRRFAGCPICNLHLRSIVTRHDEIRSHGIREVVVFHSTAAELTKHEAELPFADRRSRTEAVPTARRRAATEVAAQTARTARGDGGPDRRA